ncbi:MAG: membrane protein [Ignavibacteriaceae bacterium]|nr:MAG: membrane protein [Ignavibacteriaceae bacterium]
MSRPEVSQIDYKFEVYRKLIHICSLSIPIIYYFIPKSTGLMILSLVFLASVIVDIGRFASPQFAKIIYTIFPVFRKHELDHGKKQLSGATWLLAAAVLCIIVFPKVIAIISLAFLILGDTAAALIGRKWGKTPFLKKSLEGTMAFVVMTVIIAFITPRLTDSGLEIALIIFSGIVSAIAENVASGILDDNVAIPLSSGIVLWLGYYFLFPNLELVLKNVPV